MASPPRLQSSTNLVLICCHAIYLSGPTRGQSEREWLLAPFQSGEVPTFTSHVRAGLQLLIADSNSILVFSGSKTRPETQKSEAQGYLDLCIDNEFWGMGKEAKDSMEKRILLEEQALDSFGNLVFGLLRFWKEVGTWPDRMTIVSHEFKRARFMDLHVRALRFSRDRVIFLGINPGYMVPESAEWDEERAEDVRKGEKVRGFGAWEKDLLGQGSLLREKRQGRNCWRVGQEWFDSMEQRRKSGVMTRIVQEDGMQEEVLGREKQPWDIG